MTIFARISIMLIVSMLFMTCAEVCLAEEDVLNANSIVDSKKHCLLFYMIGDDLEDNSGSLTTDLMEIARAGSNLKIIARIGGTHRWWMPGLVNGHSYDLYLNDGKWQVLHDLGDISCKLYPGKWTRHFATTLYCRQLIRNMDRQSA